MKKPGRLYAFLDIQPGEGRLVVSLFALSFMLGWSNNFTQTAAFSLFLVRFNAQVLPYIYLLNAVIGPSLVFIYLRMGRRMSYERLLAANLGFLLLAVLASWLVSALTEASWAIFILPILFQVLVNMGNLAFWPLANRLFNVRQGKRLFGLVGAGMWTAIVITGFMIPTLVRFTGAANLLLIAALGILGAFWLQSYILRSFAAQLTSRATNQPEIRGRDPGLLKNRYILLIFTLVSCWWLAFFFLDNIFYAQAAIQYPDPEQLASFLGIFLAILGILTLISNFLITGRLIKRFGIRFSLLLLPVALLTGAAIMAATGTIIQSIASGSATLFLFWVVVVTKLLDMSLGFSVDRTSQSILYQPLAAKQRVNAQTLAEGAIQPLANGLAGVALLGLAAVFGSAASYGGQPLPLFYGLLAIVTAWVVIAVILSKEYLGQLLQALVKRRLQGGEVPVSDPSSRAFLEKGLRSPHAGVAIYSANLLAEIDPRLLETHLPTLLSHSALQVRQASLDLVQRLGLVSATDAIRQLLMKDPSAVVRGQALGALTSFNKESVLEDASPYLEDRDRQVRLKAMVVLLQHGGIEGTLMAGQKLLQMASSDDAGERKLAAEIIGEVSMRSYYQPLLPLLQDQDPQVRRAALHAAGHVNNPNLWQLIIQGLAAPRIRPAARTALMTAGEPVLDTIQGELSREGAEQVIRIQLARVCGKIGGERAIEILKSLLPVPNVDVRSQVLDSLRGCGYRADETEKPLVQEMIATEINHAAWIMASLVDLGEHDALLLLRRALYSQFALTRRRLLNLLSFLYEPISRLAARNAWQFNSNDQRAYAIEILELLLQGELKGTVLPLFEDRPPEECLLQLGVKFDQPKMGRDGRLVEIIFGIKELVSSWTRATALYAAGALPARSLARGISNSIPSSDPLVRETATWTLSRLNAAPGRQVAVVGEGFKQAQDGMIPGLEWKKNGISTMLTTIEKVLILKSVSIFAETPDDILAEVAAILEDEEFQTGSTIFHKGDIGDNLYIIVNGRVRVHDGEHTLNYLGERDVFGEMAILDPETRSASVTAVEDSQLLRLDQEALHELMEDRIEVALGIIRVLSQRLRARMRDLAQLGYNASQVSGDDLAHPIGLAEDE